MDIAVDGRLIQGAPMQFSASTPPPQFINGLLSCFLPHQEEIALPWVWESNPADTNDKVRYEKCFE